MAQKRIAAVVAAATIAMGTLAGTGCSSRDSGSNIRNADGEAPSGSEMAVDAIAARPMTLWAAAIGAVGWVVALPFTLPSGSAGDTAKAWVGGPLESTFCRPLGKIEDESSCSGDDG